MNERIKKITDELFSMEEFEYAEEFLDDAFMEKFAELIVRECAKVAEEYDCNLSGNGGEILEYFGVEE